MKKTLFRREKVIIPTYEAAQYDKNPMFLEKRVYQGSSGRVYPHPVCESVADVKTDKEYDAIFLENDYILVMILPEIGGRVQRLYDKTNGYDAVYYNEVIKPALVGLAGPWISGGIEFNWPQHHRPSTFDAVDCTVSENPDGSVTVWVGETEKMFHTKGAAGFTVYPDRAYLEIKGRVYNPTDRVQTFLWWANPAVAVNEHTQSVFPPDVHAVMDHGKRDVSKFPIADGVYYKYDYSPGTDISRYKNILVPTSYMAYHSDFDFIGNYDHEKGAGLLHVADHHVSPGKKQWTWGCGDFGRAWDRNLTDENGPYIELMTGMFTDNQPDFTFLKPYEEKTFVQYFMPYKAAGAVKNASLDAAMNIEKESDRAILTIYTPSGLNDAAVRVYDENGEIFRQKISLECSGVFKKEIQTDSALENLSAVLETNGETRLECKCVKNTEPIPSPAEALPEPKDIETTEKLFLAATHLEQYRHATRSPEDYYLEGLLRDASDIRLNNGYGKYLYNKGLFSESAKYFAAAIKSSTWKNPNPYDCEPYFNLGLALRASGDINGAFDAFYKATWDGNFQRGAFYNLACIKASLGDYETALGFCEKSLAAGVNNTIARMLKTALLRILGRGCESAEFARQTKAIDPLDTACRYELYRFGEESADELDAICRGDNHNYIELALNYIAAGLFEEADGVLSLAKNNDDPMLWYYRYYCTGDARFIEAGEKASSLYCFPNRIEDISVLKCAIDNGADMAAYYLGCLFYDKGRFDEAIRAWEGCADKINLATVYRNLALAYYNKRGDASLARKAMEKAFSMDERDARVFFELDCLYKTMGESVQARLEKMRSHSELLSRRDDLYTEFISLLNLSGEHEEALDRIMSRKFHPWEGGEGKITAQYRAALIALSRKAENKSEAASLLRRALAYPENLGEGKLIGNLDNDIYYMLGRLSDDENERREAFTLAARGGAELSSAQYYNDQPPEMAYYAAKALRELGEKERANARFDAFIKYCEDNFDCDVKIDYFAVSLPDFLIFDADLKKKNQAHCLFLVALGHLGRGETDEARDLAQKGAALSPEHAGLNAILKGEM